jgi:outer membrane protein insertion porin family
VRSSRRSFGWGRGALAASAHRTVAGAPRLQVLVALLALLFGAPLRAAKVTVAGVGLIQNRELRVSLERLLDTRAKPTLDANAVEDGAVILLAALGEEGFQDAALEIIATTADGAVRKFAFDRTFARPVPRPLAAATVQFHLTLGVRSHVDAVEFEGLTVLTPRQARAFFRSEATLVASTRTNAFSPSRMSRSSDSLLSELRQRGYAEADVRTEKARDVHGSVTLHVTVHEGPRWRVSAVRFQDGDDNGVTLPNPTGWSGKPWSSTLQEDIREAIRQAYYAKGFPDVGVHVEVEPGAEQGGEKPAAVVATIVAGPHVIVGQVRFEGNKITHESVLRRRVTLNPGDAVNPIELERSRYRISRLGVFENVDLHYEPADGPTRDPVFTLREDSRYETNLLMGYGSYEEFRGGVEFRQMNIFGLAHQSRLLLVQSVKSTSGEYAYTVPELFGESIDGTAKLFGLQRQEIAFLRQEYGSDFSLRRAIRRFHGEGRLSYTFQALRNKRNSLSTEATDEKQVNVASLTLGLTGDTRDNPLRPRHGYHWSFEGEFAHPNLGGAATYQRIEFGGAFHTGWGGSRWIHLGFTHGIITTAGSSDDRTLPVNKRFFPGGDNSIRGYQRGEAAPRDAAGKFIGAKAYMLANVELEQALTPSWSIVVFGDALGTAVALRNYPFEERLYSVGLGVRYQTLIGPIRLEYGRNLNPRPADPSGTLQLSIGFPF